VCSWSTALRQSHQMDQLQCTTRWFVLSFWSTRRRSMKLWARLLVLQRQLSVKVVLSAFPSCCFCVDEQIRYILQAETKTKLYLANDTTVQSSHPSSHCVITQLSISSLLWFLHKSCLRYWLHSKNFLSWYLYVVVCPAELYQECFCLLLLCVKRTSLLATVLKLIFLYSSKV